MSVRAARSAGLGRLIGAGAYYGAAMSEAALYRDQDVAIVGGANSAGQGALFFSRYARKVTMLIRAASLVADDVALSRSTGSRPPRTSR